MPGLDLLLPFFVAAAVFAYMPGPALLYTSAQTIARGRRAGWLAVLGLHVGGYAHVIAAALGLAVLFEAVPVLFTALKLFGAAYLCWLGLKLILATPAERVDLALPAHSPRRTFYDSVAVEVLNPKTALFFLAFLPQFTDPAATLPLWGQLLILGAIVNVMFSSADIVCVVLADRVGRWLSGSPRAGRMVQRLGGGVLVALGVNLAVQK